MTMSIRLRGLREHNLRDIDVEIPRQRLTVITGVSGSGKSSLAFDTLFREGQRRFLETLPTFSRRFAGGFARPAALAIEGIGPAVALGQRVFLGNPRSTVGTLSEVWDLLRLLFARCGAAPEGLARSRGLFSFNGEGACPACQGLGLEDRLDLDKLVQDASKTLREGALRVSTPNGYLMYSQVTLAVLDEVLQAHGGSVDIPWHRLSDEARQVVLYGSDRLKVPYGKHPLESRLKWTGITARPRQEGFYRGLVPVMEEILRGKRNDSILRFVRTSPCSACGGTRLRPEAREVRWGGASITDLAGQTPRALGRFVAERMQDRHPVAQPILQEILNRCTLMEELGLGYLAFDRRAPTLSPGEGQRLRLLPLALGDLSGLLVVLDEPSAGLHPRETGRLLKVLRRLRDRGQTVVVVDHDATLARGADWLIDLGPGPGQAGGQVLWSGPPTGVLDKDTATGRWLSGRMETSRLSRPKSTDRVNLQGLVRNNLQGLSIELQRGALHVITGVSGAGKTSLLEAILEASHEAFPRRLAVDATPIGRTPRSNPATYSGAFDLIRDLFAGTDAAKARGFGKGHFTFNTPGGRCEACEGAGVIEVGMHDLGQALVPCGTCQGRRFHEDVLAVTWRGQSMADVLEGSLESAARLFEDQPRLKRILGAFLECGLGYLPLGQPAPTLSGGEAQRVKLATELARAARGPSLIALDEPTTGLHAADVNGLLVAWDHLLQAGHTLLVVDNDPAVVGAAHHRIILGPGSGPEGGRIVMALPEEEPMPQGLDDTARERPAGSAPMVLKGVTTHNLKAVDVAFSGQGITAVTGPSGSGKSSLVFDTLLAEAQNRFNDLVTPWARRFLPRHGGAELVSAQGLRAAVAVPQRTGRRNPRSRVGTVSEVDERLRMLFSRAGEQTCAACSGLFSGTRCRCGAVHALRLASAFSPNAEAGACARCRGLGFVQRCDPDRLVSHPDRPLHGGAMGGTRFGAYLGEPDGRFMATLHQAARELGLEVQNPWQALDPAARQLAMHGAGDRVFQVAWHYRRGKTQGVHELVTPWEGLATLVDREYERVRLAPGPEAEALEGLLGDAPCPSCQGERLNEASRQVRLQGRRLPELAALPIHDLAVWLHALDTGLGLETEILRQLEALEEAGLGYLSLDREVASLSGGEAQRLRLASALHGGLTGVAYVLDEPTQGLHPRDTARLAGVLRRLAEAGNAVIVVEHDPQLLAQADQVITLGPGAGPEGGQVVHVGPADVRPGPVSPLEARPEPRVGIRVTGAHLRTLQDLDLVFPEGALTVVSGVSGSGKSTLVHGVLGASLRAGRPVGCRACSDEAASRTLVLLEQGLPAPGVASQVLTLLGLGEPLRKRFAATPEAKARKLTARHFSTASPGGRCEACEGRGVITVAMDLLPDVTMGCETCGGRRFQPSVLACSLEGRSIDAWLDMTVDEAASFLRADRLLAGPLAAVGGLGLGYLRLGQEARSLSSGELQRLRLAVRLQEPVVGAGVFLLDEPTRGLDALSVARFLAVVRGLVRSGHMVVVIEHHLDLIAAADWVIDLGPEGGPEGGRLVYQGPPAGLLRVPDSSTGAALAGRRV